MGVLILGDSTKLYFSLRFPERHPKKTTPTLAPPLVVFFPDAGLFSLPVSFRQIFGTFRRCGEVDLCSGKKAGAFWKRKGS